MPEGPEALTAREGRPCAIDSCAATESRCVTKAIHVRADQVVSSSRRTTIGCGKPDFARTARGGNIKTHARSLGKVSRDPLPTTLGDSDLKDISALSLLAR